MGKREVACLAGVTSGGEEDGNRLRICAVLSDVHFERPTTEVRTKRGDSGLEVRTRAENESTIVRIEGEREFEFGATGNMGATSHHKIVRGPKDG